MLTSTPIYKRDSQGRIRTWFYEVDGDKWRSTSGLEGGAQTTTGWTHCTPKSQPTAEAQALFEARAEEEKKLARLYRRTLEELGGDDMMFAPMLAKTWEYSKPMIEAGIYIQPKLDGIRCVATIDGLFTRQGKEITGLPHIVDSLAPFFEDFPTVVLDGELYNHEYREDFEKIVSVVRKQKTVSADASKIEYHVYDAYDPAYPEANFEDRSNLVDIEFGEGEYAHITSVTTLFVSTEVGFKQTTEDFIGMGYEGSMVRLNKPYEVGKRSKNLLKVKEFMDSEFVIDEVLEGDGNWSGYGKKIVFRMPDGRTCGAGVKGNQEFTKKLLENATSWVGKKVTIKHFGWTNDDFPRFPVAIKFWEDEKL